MTDAALKEKVAFGSIAASFLLTIGKIAAGLASGSLALLSEGAHNALDTGATILTYFAVREANKPADERHPYGRTKFESLSALAETGLLAGLACFVLVAAIRRLWVGAEPVEASWPVFAVLLVSIGVDVTRWLTLRAVAQKTGSHALAADAMHFASDLIGTALVLAGTSPPILSAFIRATPWPRSASLCSSAMPASISAARPSKPCSTRRRSASPTSCAPRWCESPAWSRWRISSCAPTARKFWARSRSASRARSPSSA